MENVISLLHETHFAIGTIRQARNRFASQLAPDFNIFDFLRTDEMGISTCIAELLKPDGKHGQGDIFLRLFLGMFELPEGWPAVIERCKVVTERLTSDGRRIDIVVESAHFIIGIENKPWAGDQLNQLSDYADFLSHKTGKKHWLLIYLSNREPDQDSIGKDRKEVLTREGNFNSLSFDQLSEWLSQCAKETKAISVRVFIEEMIKFVRNKINGELDMSEQDEVKNLVLSNNDNLQSAFDILKSINAIKEDLLEKFFLDLKESLSEKGLELSGIKNLGPAARSYAGFNIKSKSGQNKYLRFEFDAPELNRFFWGIRRSGDIKKNSATWSSINTKMQAFYYSGGSTDWWPWWSFQLPEGLDETLKNWKTSAKPWQMIQDGSLVPIIVELAVQVYGLFDDEQFNKLLMNNGE